jgi:hypothetical protein
MALIVNSMRSDLLSGYGQAVEPYDTAGALNNTAGLVCSGPPQVAAW